MLGERLGEQVDVGAGRGVGDADDLCAMGAQQGVKIEVTGIVDQHRVPGFDEEAADQIDRLRARFREDHLVGRDLDVMPAHSPRQKLAQRQKAERRPVVGECDVIGAGEGAERAPQSFLRHPGRGKPATAGL